MRELRKPKKLLLRNKRIKWGRRMGKVSHVLRKGSKAIKDLDLLKVLQSEITHEVSSNRFKTEESGSIGDFSLEWDSRNYQDVVLKKKLDTGEEIAISALLGQEVALDGEDDEDNWLPREALMKICIKKPSFSSSILQFDCGISSLSRNKSDFDIKSAYYLRPGTAVYGPLFSTLEPNLRAELKQYLVVRGVEESFTNFLLLHLHKKEQDQYVDWLHKLVVAVTPTK